MTTRSAMVSAPQPEAAEAGIDVLRAGGNAVDAAVAAAMVQGVVDPLMGGVAGFGSAAIYTPDDRRLRYLDFHAPAPLAARPDMWADIVVGQARDGFGFIVEGNVNEVGYRSHCVPAALRGLSEAHTAHGTLPWSEVLAPAIDWAERGWPIRPNVVGFWSYPAYMGHAGNPERLTHTPAGRALYCTPEGRPKRLGESVRNPDLAGLLRAVAAPGGVDDFYEGGLARTIVDDIAAHDGLLTLEDLATYRPRWAEPLWGGYRGLRVGTNQLPGGGAMLLQMLGVLEHFDLAGLGHNTVDYVRLVSEVMRRATVDKDRHYGDPAFVDVPLDRLLSAGHAAEHAAAVRAGERISVPRLGSEEGSDTTTVSVVDGDGGCVALTHSLGLPSGVVPDGLGFMHNGCMGVFDPRPGYPHSIAPGKARFSSIMPTIAFRGDDPHVVVGAPGGTQIAMGVLQVLLNVVDFGCTMEEAIVRPRFSATSDALDVVNRIPRAVTTVLEAEGRTVIRNPMSYGIAMVHGIRIGEDGRLDGGADPICDGVALGTDLPAHF